MQSINHTFFELLKFPAAELLQVTSNEIVDVFRGSFQVLYNNQFDAVLLKLGHLKIALDKSLPVIGAFSDEEKYPAYLLPTFDGFYMIKILDNKPSIALTNFETILENTSSFSRRTGMERKLGDIREPGLHTRMAVLREAYHMTKEAIARAFSYEHHSNYTLLRTFEAIQKVDSHAPIVDVSEDELQNARGELQEVVGHHLKNKYWIHFSQHEGTPASSEKISLPPFKSREPKFEEDVRTRASTGADNISTVTKDIAVENQEVVGTENQRLPSYEVQSSKAHVEQGLDKAVGRLDDAKFYQSCDLPPVGESQIKEDKTLTTGLMKPEKSNEDQRQNLGVDLSFRRAQESENWSNASNPSETPAKGSDLSSVSSESNGFDIGSLGANPVITTTGLTHSQSLNDNLLASTPDKDNLKMKHNTSEKESMKQKSIPEQPLDKENVKSSTTV